MARNDMKKRIIKLQFNAPVILLFTLFSLGALIAGHFTDGWTTTKFFSVYRWDPKDFWSYIRLFGHVLGHVSWEHYMGNMVLLLVVGPPLEDRYGSWAMLWWIPPPPFWGPAGSYSCSSCSPPLRECGTGPFPSPSYW